MAIHSYFFKYDLDSKSFKFCAEAHGVEDVKAAISADTDISTSFSSMLYFLFELQRYVIATS